MHPPPLPLGHRLIPTLQSAKSHHLQLLLSPNFAFSPTSDSEVFEFRQSRGSRRDLKADNCFAPCGAPDGGELALKSPGSSAHSLPHQLRAGSTNERPDAGKLTNHRAGQLCHFGAVDSLPSPDKLRLPVRLWSPLSVALKTRRGGWWVRRAWPATVPSPPSASPGLEYGPTPPTPPTTQSVWMIILR